jgi:hypothetical protein
LEGLYLAATTQGKTGKVFSVLQGDDEGDLKGDGGNKGVISDPPNETTNWLMGAVVALGFVAESGGW